MLYKALKDKEKDFLCSTIETKEQLVDLIQSHKSYCPPHREIIVHGQRITNDDSLNRKHYIIYRGIRESKFHLNTSLQFRWKEIKHFHPSFSQKKYLVKMVELLEKNSMIKEYLNKGGKSYTDISILALMQHYGLPTPLLDWTPSIETGLNFAFDWIALDGETDKISNYASLYYINLFENHELEAASYQNILVDAEVRISDALRHFNPNSLDRVDLSGASLKSLFSVKDLDIDFIYIDYSKDAPYVQDIFGNVLSLINPNLEKQEGAFIINFHSRANLDFYWNKKNSTKGTRVISETESFNDKLGVTIKTSLSENPNAIGIIPQTRICCANIKKSVLVDWVNNGGKNEHYDNSEESRRLKVSTLETYYSWLLSRKKDYSYFRSQFVKKGESEDQKIAKSFLERYISSHSR